MDRLTAKTNEKIKHAVSVRSSARKRSESSLFFLEGVRLCGDAVQSGAAVERAFFTREALEKYPRCQAVAHAAGESYEITEELAEKLSDTPSPQGVFCLCRSREISANADKMLPGGKYILLENVQDPSNLGAVSRTAEALGIDGLVVSGGCDIYNPKALRASMGSILRLNIATCSDAPAFIAEAEKKGFRTFSSTPDPNSLPVSQADFSGGTLCVVGNEGNGVSAQTAAACRYSITIPMGGRAESLNAATAAAILIWEMVRK